MHIVEFIMKYLDALGIADDEKQAFASKVMFTAAGKVLLELDESDTDRPAFLAAMDRAGRGDGSAFGSIDRAFPDGKHRALFKKAVVWVLLDATAACEDALTDGSKAELRKLVSELK